MTKQSTCLLTTKKAFVGLTVTLLLIPSLIFGFTFSPRGSELLSLFLPHLMSKLK